MSNCASCGKEVPEGVGFCSSCGAPAQGQLGVPPPPAIPPQQAEVPKVSNYLVPSILTTLFCCLPLGVVAIIFAAKVNGKLASGDVQGAMSASKTAKILCWTSLGAGLLWALAVIPIISAIAIPNFLDAKERAKQKRSISDVRSIASALQSWNVDFDMYPNSNGQVVSLESVNRLADETGDTKMPGENYLVPDYIQAFPSADGWGNPFYYVSDGQHFLVLSYGSDGKADPDLQDYIQGWLSETPTAPGSGYEATNCYESDIIWGDSSFLKVPDGKQRKC